MVTWHIHTHTVSSVSHVGVIINGSCTHYSLYNPTWLLYIFSFCIRYHPKIFDPLPPNFFEFFFLHHLPNWDNVSPLLPFSSQQWRVGHNQTLPLQIWTLSSPCDYSLYPQSPPSIPVTELASKSTYTVSVESIGRRSSEEAE